MWEGRANARPPSPSPNNSSTSGLVVTGGGGGTPRESHTHKHGRARTHRSSHRCSHTNAGAHTRTHVSRNGNGLTKQGGHREHNTCPQPSHSGKRAARRGRNTQWGTDIHRRRGKGPRVPHTNAHTHGPPPVFTALPVRRGGHGPGGTGGRRGAMAAYQGGVGPREHPPPLPSCHRQTSHASWGLCNTNTHGARRGRWVVARCHPHGERAMNGGPVGPRPPPRDCPTGTTMQTTAHTAVSAHGAPRSAHGAAGRAQRSHKAGAAAIPPTHLSGSTQHTAGCGAKWFLHYLWTVAWRGRRHKTRGACGGGGVQGANTRKPPP